MHPDTDLQRGQRVLEVHGEAVLAHSPELQRDVLRITQVGVQTHQLKVLHRRLCHPTLRKQG